MPEEVLNNTQPEEKLPVDVVAPINLDPVEIKKVKEDIPEGIPERKKFFYTKKVCKFCTKQLEVKVLNYKNVDVLRRFVMPSGKILPRRISGNCAKHQRAAVREIKKARIIALLPFLDR
jgi:small subunit ribosomal protein S18